MSLNSTSLNFRVAGEIGSYLISSPDFRWKQLQNAPEIQKCLFPKPPSVLFKLPPPLAPRKLPWDRFPKEVKAIGLNESCDLQTWVISVRPLFQTLSFIQPLSANLRNLHHSNPSRSLLSLLRMFFCSVGSPQFINMFEILAPLLKHAHIHTFTFIRTSK